MRAAPRGHRGRRRDARALVRGAGRADRGRRRLEATRRVPGLMPPLLLRLRHPDGRGAVGHDRAVQPRRRPRPAALASRQRLDDRSWLQPRPARGARTRGARRVADARCSCPSHGSSSSRACSRPAPSDGDITAGDVAARVQAAQAGPERTQSQAPGRFRAVSAADGPRHADALVVFGITGDLAKKMTLRSLYRLERRGLLDLPVIGVAADDWTVEKLREHAREAIAATGEQLDEHVFERFADRLRYVSGDFGDSAYVRAGGTGARRGGVSGVLPRDPTVAVRDRDRRAGEPEAARRRRAGGGREAVRARPRVGARAGRRSAQVRRRVPALPDRPFPRQDGARGDPLPALRERDARARLEPQLRQLGADHAGRGLRRRGSRALLRPRRGPPRRGRQPPAAGARGRRDGAARGRRSRHDQ